MTEDELNAEFDYRVAERAALLGFTDPKQRIPAKVLQQITDEADAAIEQLRSQKES